MKEKGEIVLNKKPFYTFLLATAVASTLAACNSDTNGSGEGTDGGEEGTGGEAVEGGNVNLGMMSPPDNLFNPIFYTSMYDSHILEITHEGLVQQDEEFNFIPELAEDWEFSDDNRELTYFLREDVKWHDGEDFTADDVVFTFTAMADPDYAGAGGIRQNYVNTLAGYEDYVSGESDTFAGVEKIDDYTVKFIFEEPSVKALADTSMDIIPEHIFGDVPVADIPSHAGSINAGEVIGTGPFQLTEMLENEQYVLTANEDYYKGAPKLDSITWNVVSASVVAGMLEQGELDYVPRDFPAADVATIDGNDNLTVFEQAQLGYQYLGMKINHGPNDSLTDPNSWEPNEKLQDVELRQAIVHAINRQEFIDGFLRGHGELLDAPFPSASWAYNPDAVEGLAYDPDLAKQKLADAGYEDANGDGFVEDPDGNELVLNLDYPTGNPVREQVAPVMKEQLEAVGIQVNLNTPREAPAHFEIIEQNDTDVDLFLAGWSLSSGDPDPWPINGGTAGYNYSRFLDEEQEKLLQEAVNPELAFDNQEFRAEKYGEWAQLFIDNAYTVPLYAETELHVYNKRLAGLTIKPFTFKDETHEWHLTE
jgi:peptide/nickel transport system substrate-binding protein